MATLTPTEISPDDLLLIQDRPMPELVDGELLERTMGQKSDAIAATIGRLVGNFVADHQLGLVNGAQGSYRIFPDDPSKVRIPDVSFTKRDRVPNGGPAEGHSRVAPDLVIEVISPNDEAESLVSKIGDFFAAGVPLIWAIFPDSRTVFIYRIDGSAQRLQVGDVLDGEAILPGFRCDVAALFA